LYKADIDSQDYRDFKMFYAIRNIRESGLIESLNDFYLKPTIVLFGSAASGIDTETSDIDLVVISEKTERIADLAKFEKKLRRKIQVFNITNIKELGNNLANNVLNGITIQGKVKWI
ncbi:nucleotidyltransferase domain-containing protein, partial [Candidatus Woesearchaeota archaeon]|nr:nucleotidyltransferase domain-containing protein [Candidatus Woesearchaeota archaeon]